MSLWCFGFSPCSQSFSVIFSRHLITFVGENTEDGIEFIPLICIDQNDGVFLPSRTERFASFVLQAKLLCMNHVKVLLGFFHVDLMMP